MRKLPRVHVHQYLITIYLHGYSCIFLDCLQDDYEILASQIADGESLAMISVSYNDAHAPSVFKSFISVWCL